MGDIGERRGCLEMDWGRLGGTGEVWEGLGKAGRDWGRSWMFVEGLEKTGRDW